MPRRPHPLMLALLIALMVLIWAFNFIIGKVALRHFDPVTLAAFRIELASLIMGPIFLGMSRRTRFEIRDFGDFAFLGLFGVVINQGCFTVGLNYTTVGHSAIIVAMTPILILLLACAIRLETLTTPKGVGMALSFIGAVVLATEKSIQFHSGTLVGDLITFGCSAGFSIYAVYGKKVARKYDTVSMNTFNYLAGAIILLPLAIRQGVHLRWSGVGWAGWVSIAYMAAMSSVAGYLIYYWALRHMAASQLATFTYIQPVLVTILGVLLLGENVTHHLLIGGVLVLAGVYTAERGLGEKAIPPEPV